VPAEDVPDKQQTIDDAARTAGRDPSDIRRIWNVIGTIDEPGTPAHDGPSGLTGDAEVWTDFLTRAVVELGFDTFIFWPVATADRTDGQQLTTFATDVVPAVRQRVADDRSAR
jgi:hypothetical protein